MPYPSKKKPELIEQVLTRIAAYDALQAAIKALQQVTPHGRDDPGDNDACVADRDKHYARLKKINALRAEIMSEAIYIKEQIK